MGFGLLFRLDESSLGSHLNERRVRGEEGPPAKDETGVDDTDLVSGSDEEPTHENLQESSKDPESSAENRGALTEGSVHSLTQSSLHLSTSEVTHSDEIPAQQKDALSIDTSQTTTGGNSISSFAPQLEDLIDRALRLGVAAPSPKEYSKETTRPEESNLEEKKGSVRDKPYISKADRRKLKKGQKSSDGGATVPIENEREEDESSLGELDNKNAKPTDQDEEERSIRMALLAFSGKVNKDDSNLPNQHADNGNAKNNAAAAITAMNLFSHMPDATSR
ncbi:hypothetical protein AKJ16_DCAP18234 [Drosera capensis]